MLLINKLVKLLDDFHFQLYHDHLKYLSKRSYYPLLLVDVIERDPHQSQTSETIYFKVYGERDPDEKDLKKLFQLAHYTFRQVSFLSKNYPDYLQHNITRIQHCINTGELQHGMHLADMLAEVAGKVEDHDTLIKVYDMLAQCAALLEERKDSLKYYEEIEKMLVHKSDLNRLHAFLNGEMHRKTKEADRAELEGKLAFLDKFKDSDSISVRLMSRINTCYLLHHYRDTRFYDAANFEEMTSLQEDIDKYDFVIMPYLHNLRAKLSFLRLNYSIRQLDSDTVLAEAAKIIEDSEDELFWNSFINLPEFNSIGIQTSHFVSNYFYSYRDDHADMLSDEARERITLLRQRAKRMLENEMLQENFVVRYINMTTIYSGLLLLGDRTDIRESIDTLEGMLLFFQQVPFHAYIDPIYTTLIMGSFCLEDYEHLEKSYRRYKKSTKGKVVNPENDLALHGFYYAAKWRETQRKQYTRKLSEVIETTQEKNNLNATRKTLLEVVEYFKIPVTLATI